jgi:hypothetical protein
MCAGWRSCRHGGASLARVRSRGHRRTRDHRSCRGFCCDCRGLRRRDDQSGRRTRQGNNPSGSGLRVGGGTCGRYGRGNRSGRTRRRGGGSCRADRRRCRSNRRCGTYRCRRVRHGGARRKCRTRCCCRGGCFLIPFLLNGLHDVAGLGNLRPVDLRPRLGFGSCTAGARSSAAFPEISAYTLGFVAFERAGVRLLLNHSNFRQ